MYFLKENIENIKKYGNLLTLNKKKNKEYGVYLWSEYLMASKILNNAININEDTIEEFHDKALWLAIRLKFTSDEVIKLMLNFYNEIIDYNGYLFGIKIFDVMKENSITYPEALLIIYENHINFQSTKEFAKYNRGQNRGNKLYYSNLDKTGKIIYTKEEDNFLNLTEKEREILRQNIERKAKEFFE